jgi:hypothetical protein
VLQRDGFNTKIAQEQTLFEKGSGSYKLALVNEDGFKVKATVQTTNGSYSVVSDVIKTNEWIIAGLRLRNGQLQLRVNKNEYSAAAPGAIVHGGFSNNLVIGQSFQGYMGDLKIGEVRTAVTLVHLGNDTGQQTLPIGNDGKAVFTVKSNGVQVTNALMQRVGFTLTRSDQQTADNQPLVQDVRIAQQVFNRLTGLSFVQYANAQQVSGNAEHQNEDGIGIVDKELYGWFTEAALKGVFGDAYDPIKTSLTFLYEMSGISDIGTIITILGDLLAGKKFQTEQAIDLGFATIGLTLTVVAVVTGGAGGGLKAVLKKPLEALKALLKELFINPADILKLVKGGGTIIKRTFSLLKGFVKGDPKAAKELADIVSGMKKAVADTSGKTLKFMMAMAQSPKRFARFVKLIRTSEKAAAAGNCVVDSTAQLIRQRLLPLSVTSAYASGDGCDLLGDIAAVAARNKKQVASDMTGIVNRLGDAKIFLNENSKKILEDLLSKGQAENITKFIDNLEGSAAGTLHDMHSMNINSMNALLSDSTVSVFDELFEALSFIPHRNSDELSEKLREISYRNISGPRGLYAEAATSRRLANQELVPGGNPLIFVDPDTMKLGDNVDTELRNNTLGIDIEGVLIIDYTDEIIDATVKGSNRPVSIEVKNYSSSTASKARKKGIDGLSAFDKQAIKHFETKITPNIKQNADGSIGWAEGKPHLHYELHGGAWKTPGGADSANLKGLMKILIQVCKDKKKGRKNKLLAKVTPKFDCEKDITFHVNEIYPEPLTSKPK